jgi:dTDP-4-dehydrorhamnose 3,5-epimerase-like enzyme
MPEQKMTMEELVVHADARGCLFEPLMEQDFPAQRNGHIVVTRPGGIRGNHAHRRRTEIITVTGEALVRARVNGRVQEVTVPAGHAVRFRFPPGVSHAVKNTGTADNILVAFSTETHDPAAPDAVQDVLIS